MIRYVIPSLSLIGLIACAPLHPLEPQPYDDFRLLPTKESRAPILPDGVAVLAEYPACAFEAMGEARVASNRVEITPSRVKALREQAALYGADAIIVHPNMPVCADGSNPPICPGRGEYVIATAIQYLDDPAHMSEKTGLEYEFKRGYDTVEFYNHDIH